MSILPGSLTSPISCLLLSRVIISGQRSHLTQAISTFSLLNGNELQLHPPLPPKAPLLTLEEILPGAPVKGPTSSKAHCPALAQLPTERYAAGSPYGTFTIAAPDGGQGVPALQWHKIRPQILSTVNHIFSQKIICAWKTNCWGPSISFQGCDT